MNGRPWEGSLAPLALCLGSVDADGTESSFRLCVDALRDAHRFSLPSLLYKALPDARASSVRSVHQEKFADVHADFLCALCGIAFPGVQGFAAVSVLMLFGPYCRAAHAAFRSGPGGRRVSQAILKAPWGQNRTCRSGRANRALELMLIAYTPLISPQMGRLGRLGRFFVKS